MTVTELARRAGCGRSHLAQVLNGTRTGPETRLKIMELLSREDVELLGWKVPEIDYQI